MSLIISRIFFWCLLPAALILPKSVFAQNGSSKIIDFRMSNETVRSALNRLSSEYEVNLTYNASDPDFDTKISYTAQGKTITEVLDDILQEIHYSYQNVGNHLVIIRLPESATSGSSGLRQKQPPPQNLPSLKADTVFIEVEKQVIVRDTLILRDTIVKTEQTIIHDTVVVEKIVELTRRGARPVSVNRDAFRFEPDRRNGWAASFSYTQLAAGYHIISEIDVLNLQELKDSEKLSFRNFGLGAALQYNAERLSVSAGAGLFSFSNRFYYSETFATGGYTRTDTLDTFFTIIASDTIWRYVTDTTWIPLNKETLNYDRLNRFGLLEFGIDAQLVILEGRNYSWYLNAGFGAATPLWFRGNTISSDDNFPAIKLNSDNFNSWMLNYRFGAGGKRQLTDWTDIYAEITYKRFTGETSLNHPLDRRLHGVGLKFGLIYYL